MTGPGWTWPDLAPVMADGLACVMCAREFLLTGRPSVPVGWCRESGRQVFACVGSCADHATTRLPGQNQSTTSRKGDR